MQGPYPHWGLGTSLVSQAPHLLLSCLDEQESGLMSFTLEIEPGDREHVLPTLHVLPHPPNRQSQGLG